MKIKISFLIISLSCFLNCTNNEENKNKTDSYTLEQFSLNDNGKKNGEYKIYYPNGNIKYLINYTNGELNGKQIKFFENGKYQSIAYYKNNNIDSVEKWYYPSGILKKELFRLDFKKFGTQYYYDTGGFLMESEFLINDSIYSSKITFNEKGLIEKVIGSIIYCIYDYNKNERKNHLGAIFYLNFPINNDNYKIQFEFVKKSNSNYISKIDSNYVFVNHSWGILKDSVDIAQFTDIGGVVNIYDKNGGKILSDSTFIKL
ncbi:MAG: hypothetical protein JSR00_09335 [Bacteroidetes bacterium]|nr:hypothetical protein [Bacteroidota bacterium]